MNEQIEHLIRDIERPRIEITVAGVPAESWVLLLPAPGGLTLQGSPDIHPAHLVKAFRKLADAMEIDHGTVCNCRECD